MAFKVNDLLIHVETDEHRRLEPQCQIMMLSGGCKTSPLLTLTPWIICLVLTYSYYASIDCENVPTKRGGKTGAVPSELLAALKAQLRLALDEIEHQSTEAEGVLEPQTVAEINGLQGKLRKAIKTLDARKERLKRK